MVMAEQGGGKDWPSSALTLPAQPPASWRTSERTFVWAAKLNLPPSCQGIGKAVRGEEKGESGEGAAGGTEGGRERGRQAGSSQSPSYSGTAQGSFRLSIRTVWVRDTQAGVGPPGLQGQAPGVSRSVPQPRERPSFCAPLEGRAGKLEGRSGKSLRQVEG